VAVFLLREWISQNARPGVFEDEELLPDDPQPVLPLQPQPLGPGPGPPGARLVFANPQHRRPLHPLPPVNAPAPRPIEVRELHDALLAMEAADPRRQNSIPPMASDPTRWDIEGRRDGSNRRPKKKRNKVKQSDGEDDDSPRAQRKMEKDAEVRRKIHRRIHMAKSTAVRQRMTTRRAVSSSPPLREVNDTNNTVEQKHEFTCTSSLPESSSDRSSAGQSRESSVDLTSSWQSLPAISTPSPAIPTIGPSRRSPQPEQTLPESPFPSVTLQPPSGSIPFSLRSLQPIEPPPPYPSRPVLPTSPLPRSGSSSPFLNSPGRTNLDSPSHSTYLAPEELVASFEAGPSDYFARENGDSQCDVGHLNGKMKAAAEPESFASQNHGSSDDTESLSDLGPEDIQAEHDRYFGNPFDAKDESGPAVSLELLTDSESDVTTEDGGIAELDEEDRQPPIIFWDDGAGAGALRDDGNARGEGNIVRADPAPQGQAAAAANQPAAEGPAAANAENDEADANVEDDMEGAMEGWFFRLFFDFSRCLLQYSSYWDERPDFWRLSECVTSLFFLSYILIFLTGCVDDFRA